MSNWQLQDAKAQLSEAVNKAAQEGPQHITLHVGRWLYARLRTSNLADALRRIRAMTCAAAGVALFSPTSVLAQTQPYKSVQEQKLWSLEVGGGPVYGFSANGGSTRETNLTPWISFTYDNRFYVNGLDGVGYNLIHVDDLRVGGQLRPRYASGNAAGGTLERPDFGIDATVYAFKRLAHNVVVGGRVTHDLSGVSDGTQLFASVGHQKVTRVGLLQTIGYVRAGDRKVVSAYYGITPADSIASGLPAYSPGGGVQNAGVAALLMVPFGDRYGAGGFINYERVLGDAADSPLVDRANIWRAGLIVVRRFGKD